MSPTGRGGNGKPQATDLPELDVESLSRVTQEHVSGLFGRDSMYMVLWALQLLVAAVLTPITTRVLAPEQFGRVAASMAVMQVVSILAGLGLQTAIQREYASGADPRGARRLLTVTVLGAALVVGVLDLTGPAWSGTLGFPSYAGPLRLAVFWAGLSAVTAAGLALLRSQDRLLAFAVVSLLQSVVAEVLALGLAAVVVPTASAFVFGQLLAQTAAVLLTMVLVPPAMVLPRHRALVESGLRYGLPLVPAMLSSFVLGAFDRLVIQHDLGSTVVARYQIAYNIGSAPMLLLGVLDSVWMPRIFSLGDVRLRAAVLASSRDTLYRLLVPVMVGLSLSSPLVLRVWAPPEFRPEGLLWLTSVIIISAIPYAASLSAMRALLAQGHSTALAVASVTAAAANAALNLVLVPRLGLMGAAVATLGAYALLHVLLVLRARRSLRIPRPGLRLVVLVTIGSAVAVGTCALPTTTGWLVLRATGTLVCVTWFVAVAWRTIRPAGAGLRPDTGNGSAVTASSSGTDL